MVFQSGMFRFFSFNRLLRKCKKTIYNFFRSFHSRNNRYDELKKIIALSHQFLTPKRLHMPRTRRNFIKKQLSLLNFFFRGAMSVSLLLSESRGCSFQVRPKAFTQSFAGLSTSIPQPFSYGSDNPL